MLGGSFRRPFGRKPYGATSCRARLPRHRPQPVPAVTPRCCAIRAGPGRHARAGCADRRAKGHSHRCGTPRIVRVGPSSVKGTPRSFLTASQKGSSGPTLERRSLCRPSGPDGEGQARGQARNARGEPWADEYVSSKALARQLATSAELPLELISRYPEGLLDEYARQPRSRLPVRLLQAGLYLWACDSP